MATRRITNTDNNSDVAIDIPGAEEVLQEAADHVPAGNPRQLPRSIFWVATCTLVTIVNRTIYKLPPPGGIFEGHETAYYLTLSVAFLAGVAEVYAAILLTSAGRGGRTWWATPLLCASVVVLAAVIALGGSPVLVMG